MGLGQTIVSGIAISAFTVAIGAVAARFYTERRAKVTAALERNLAAAAELSRAYGSFFGAWKLWNSRDDDTLEPMSGADRLALLARVAEAEGVLESFLVRITLEHKLGDKDLDRLWCFRRAYKQLRYRVRDREPLEWRRTDSETDPLQHARFRAYQAFKALAASAAGLLIHSRGARPPDLDEALRNLRYVTGPGTSLRVTYGAQLATAKKERDPLLLLGDQRNWEWVVIDEALASEGARSA